MAVLRTSSDDHHACWAASGISLPLITSRWEAGPLHLQLDGHTPPSSRGASFESQSQTAGLRQRVLTDVAGVWLLGREVRARAVAILC